MHSKKHMDKMAKVNDKGIKEKQKKQLKLLQNMLLEMLRNVLRL